MLVYLSVCPLVYVCVCFICSTVGETIGHQIRHVTRVMGSTGHEGTLVFDFDVETKKILKLELPSTESEHYANTE